MADEVEREARERGEKERRDKQGRKRERGLEKRTGGRGGETKRERKRWEDRGRDKLKAAVSSLLSSRKEGPGLQGLEFERMSVVA